MWPPDTLHSQERVSVSDPTDTVCRNAADPMSLVVIKSALRFVEIERKEVFHGSLLPKVPCSHRHP